MTFLWNRKTFLVLAGIVCTVMMSKLLTYEHPLTIQLGSILTGSGKTPKILSGCDNMQCTRFQEHLAQMQPGQMKAAIYYLVQPQRINRLTQSLHALDTYFNDQFRYPVIIFHEHDFTGEDVQKVRNATKSDLFFQTIPFTRPDFITRPIRVDKWGLGYRNMCRFQCKLLYQQPIVEHLDFIWRLDDDSNIKSDIKYDIFRFMSDHDIMYGYSIVCGDSPSKVAHLRANASLFIEQNNISTQFFDKWPKNGMFYNNFEVSSMKLWMSREYQDYIRMIDDAGGIYYNRWGDAPIKSIAVSMFVPLNKTHCFRDFQYSHQYKTSGRELVNTTLTGVPYNCMGF